MAHEYPTPPPTSSPNRESPRYKQQQPMDDGPYFQQVTNYDRTASPNHWDTQPTKRNSQEHKSNKKDTIIVEAPTGISEQYEYLPALPARRPSTPTRTERPSSPTGTHNYPRRPSPTRTHRTSSPTRAPKNRAEELRNPYYNEAAANEGRNPYYNPPAENGVNPYYNAPAPSTKGRRSPSLRKASPKPFFFSPQNQVPSPYNVSRPGPRPGLLKRILYQLRAWGRKLKSWIRRHPIITGAAVGALAFLPLIAAGPILAAASAMGHAMGAVRDYTLEGLGGKVTDERKKKLQAKAEEQKKKEYGWGLDHFVGFGGTKGGPVEGILKIMQMLVNHYCKFTPSAMPRAGALLLEVYFLASEATREKIK